MLYNIGKDDDMRSNKIKEEDLRKKKEDSLSDSVNSLKGYMKGDNSMENIVDTMFEKRILGLRDLRSNLSEVMGKAINSFEEILSGNVKKGGETASIISTKLLTEILEAYKFNPTISFDEATNQYEVAIDEIGIYGSGDTKEEAIEVAVDLVIDSTNDYFDNRELYMRIPDMREKFPYYLRISHCSNIEELLEVLNLD